MPSVESTSSRACRNRSIRHRRHLGHLGLLGRLLQPVERLHRDGVGHPLDRADVAGQLGGRSVVVGDHIDGPQARVVLVDHVVLEEMGDAVVAPGAVGLGHRAVRDLAQQIGAERPASPADEQDLLVDETSRALDRRRGPNAPARPCARALRSVRSGPRPTRPRGCHAHRLTSRRCAPRPTLAACRADRTGGAVVRFWGRRRHRRRRPTRRAPPGRRGCRRCDRAARRARSPRAHPRPTTRAGRRSRRDRADRG